ncbi:dienelactone hydrolase family protein [Rhodococcus sp. G-MC3]|uniref:dienelactone hydrolase family protein n=1 Tax=Rhodococcus sp. G-MC3 TaxID=3046209 RepID=UPI0024B8B519|nr:dienelactone hydrolase family protein [Rhodococcus sp. G-MC3]MDJ0396785.1 dienelactone hydrolase family protein [Rhodococcus sp. G-MC3]
MCHSYDSRPPFAPSIGKVKEHGSMLLKSQDGTTVLAYEALPETPNGSALVILPDVRGVHAYYQDLAQRLAEAGYAAVVIDYYGRTTDDTNRDESFDFKEHLAVLESANVARDADAAAAYLKDAHPEAAVTVFSVGFCFGGSQSWRLAATSTAFAGNIGFYGQPKLVADVLPELHAPLLLLLAGNDVVTGQEEFNTFATELSASGKPYELKVYDGAPHSFFDRSYDEHRGACADAWTRLLSFTDTYATA